MEIKQIQELIQLMMDNDLSELDVRDGDCQISLKRGAGGSVQHFVVPHAPGAVPAANPAGVLPAGSVAPGTSAGTQPQMDEGLKEIDSPMVGTFYAASDPENAPFVTVGSRVEADTTVCIIEAMKVFNEIKSEFAGTIEQILVKNEEAVEYGQPLFLIRAD